MPARAAAAAASLLTTSRGTPTICPWTSRSIASSAIRCLSPGFGRIQRPARAERVHLPPPDDVEMPAVGHDRAERAVRVCPQLLARARVEPVRSAVERREVDDAVDDGRRARDRPVGVEFPEDLPRGGVERVERLVVRADEDAALPDRGRA